MSTGIAISAGLLISGFLLMAFSSLRTPGAALIVLGASFWVTTTAVHVVGA